MKQDPPPSGQDLEARYLATGGAGPAPGRDAASPLRRLQESLAWAGFRIQPQGRRSIQDTYFDTPDQKLHAAGWSYRRRRDETGERLVLKEVTRSRGGVFDRMAVEQTLSGDVDDVARPPAGAVGDRLSNLLPPGAQVAPLFTVQARRSAYRLSHPQHPRGLVEMAFDETRIEPGASPPASDGSEEASSVAFNELALALTEGPHELLAEILAAVELEPALLQARVSRFERGLLAGDWPLARQPQRALPASRQSRALDVALRYLKLQFGCLRLYEPHVWESVHPRAVHQMRVAIRRARAALRAFAPVLPEAERRQLEPGLRALARTLGAVRDLDVQLLQIPAYRAELGTAGDRVLDRYQQHLLERRADAHQRLVAWLASPAHVQTGQHFRQLLEAGAGLQDPQPPRLEDIARRQVLPQLQKAGKRGGRIDAGSPDEDLHRLRLQTKRLRYQFEILQGAYGDDLEEPARALRKLQKVLGRHQDACVARSQLAAYRREQAPDKASRKAIGQLRKLEKRKARRNRARFDDDWARFEQATADLPERL